MRIVIEWHDRYFDEMKQHSVVCLAGMWYNKGNAGSYTGENEMKTIHEIVRFFGGRQNDGYQFPKVDAAEAERSDSL